MNHTIGVWVVMLIIITARHWRQVYQIGKGCNYPPQLVCIPCKRLVRESYREWLALLVIITLLAVALKVSGY